MSINDRIAKALGVGDPERDDETRISALVALVTAVDGEHREEQVVQLALGQRTTAALVELLGQFQAESSAEDF